MDQMFSVESGRRCMLVNGPVIVGAGPSGLAVGACLREQGVPFIILERADCIASLWQKRTYDRLKLHLPKKFCQLPKMAFPASFPEYPTRRQFINYLESYARHFDIKPQFNESVESAKYDETMKLWRVRSGVAEYWCRWLVVATGENAECVVPDIDGLADFGGKVIHSSEYKSGDAFRGQKVLVVGCGNSGMEVSFDLSNHNAVPSMVCRSSVHVLPREIMGKSTFELAMLLMKWLPLWLVDKILLVCTWFILGDMEKYGFSYTIPSSDIHGGVRLKSPPPNDFDQRDIFALYLLPGDSLNIRVFRKSIVFLVDISGSMKGAPIENVKKALMAFLSKLNQDDFFNIIAFNGEISLFSSSMELATQEALRQATEWMSLKLVAAGDTDILLAVNKALEMVSNQSNLMTIFFLITDGAVENERDICKIVKERCTRKAGSPSLRISTFGIGSYCNHYFLRLLAQIGRGYYDVAYEADSVTSRLQMLCTMSSSVVLSNIEVDCFNHVKSLTLYPSTIQDLSSGCPVIVSGRCQGKLPETVTLRGILADMSKFTTDLKIQKAKDIPLDKVFAQRQIDVLTAEAWFTGTKEIEKQVTEISMQTGVPSEYTRMILVHADSEDQEQDSITVQGKEVYNKAGLQKLVSSGKLIPFPSLGIGFGDLKKTAENFPSGVILKAPDTSEIILRTATGCCKRVTDRVCCMCFIQAFSKVSDQCVITLSQICAFLSCFECIECCFDLCGDCN